MTNKKYVVCIDKTHPAYLKRGVVRRDDGSDMVLIEWCTWSRTICTWVFKTSMSGITK